MASNSNSARGNGAIARVTRRGMGMALLGASSLGLFSLGLAGCGANAPPPRKLVLTPVTSFPQGLPRVKWSLVIDEPSAGRQIDTTQIAVMDGTYRIRYYADAEWADAAPIMVRDLLVQSFRNSGSLPAVGSTRLGLSADVALVSTLTKFQVETGPGGAQQAVVALEATLLQQPRRNPIATARFEKATPISDIALETVGAAFDESLGDVMRRIVPWTLASGTAAAVG